MKARKRDARAAGPPAPDSSASRNSTPWFQSIPVLSCALVLLSLAAYFTAFSAGFALDWGPVLKDPRIRELSVENLSQILSHSYWWPSGEAGLYRPVTTFSWLINYTLLGNGTNPAGYHIVNWLLHAGNIILVFLLILRLAGSSRKAFLIAGLWSVHPLLTEAVTNVAGRSDLLGAGAVLGGLLLYTSGAGATGSARVLRMMALALVAAAGVGSKESAVVLPGVLALYELTVEKTIRWRALASACAVTLAAMGAVLLLRWKVLSATLPAEFPFTDNPITGTGFWQGRLTALSVMGRYLWLTIWPAKLSSDYSFAEIPLASGSAADWLAWTAIAAAASALIIAFRYNRLVFFLAGFALLNFLPASNLLFPTGTIMAERLMYLPSMGLVAILVLAIDRLAGSTPRSSVAAIVLCGAIAIAYSVRTSLRNLDWRDDFTMSGITVQTSPNSFKVHRLLAADLLQSEPTRGNIERAVSEGEKSIAILSRLPDADDTLAPWNITASARLLKGDFETCSVKGGKPEACQPRPTEARREYQRAEELATRGIQVEAAGRAAYNRRNGTQVAPADALAETYRNLASARLHLGKPDESLSAAIEARKLNPSNPDVYEQIADAHLAVKRAGDAALALIEGMFITSDPGLRQDLLTLYQSGFDTQHCAVVAGPNGPALNPSCELVRRDFCTVGTKLNRQDVMKQMACGTIGR